MRLLGYVHRRRTGHFFFDSAQHCPGAGKVRQQRTLWNIKDAVGIGESQTFDGDKMENRALRLRERHEGAARLSKLRMMLLRRCKKLISPIGYALDTPGRSFTRTATIDEHVVEDRQQPGF